MILDFCCKEHLLQLVAFLCTNFDMWTFLTEKECRFHRQIFWTIKLVFVNPPNICSDLISLNILIGTRFLILLTRNCSKVCRVAMGKVCREFISGLNLYWETTKEWIFFFNFYFLVVTQPPLPLCIVVSVTMDRIRILTHCTVSHNCTLSLKQKRFWVFGTDRSRSGDQ